MLTTSKSKFDDDRGQDLHRALRLAGAGFLRSAQQGYGQQPSKRLKCGMERATPSREIGALFFEFDRDLFAMTKQLVRARKAFPNRVFVIVSLLLCLSADGALAAQGRKPPSGADCTSAANKNKPPCAVESPTGQVTFFMPKLSSNTLARWFNSQVEVWIDKAMVGIVSRDAPLTVSLPNGPYKFELKRHGEDSENIGKMKETQITVSGKKPLYFQVIDQGLAIAASELDACTAQAVIIGSDAKTPSGSGTIYLYWPKPSLSFGFLEELASDLPVFLDGKRVGAVKLGEYLVIKASSGEHTLGLDVGLGFSRLLTQDFILGAGLTRHFHVEKSDTVRMSEDPPEEAGDFAKGLRQREVIQASLSGKEPKDRANASTSQTAISGRESKDKPDARASLAALTGSDRNTPTGPGTIYLYWPKPSLGFGFLDDLATELPVFLDGKRIGAVKLGEYLVVKAPSGDHALGLDVGLSGRLLKKDFNLGAGSARHFHVESHDTVRMFEDSPEEAADHVKGLRQREVIVQ